MRATSRLGLGIAACATVAGCSLLVSFDELPPDPLIATGPLDAGTRDRTTPPPTDDDDDVAPPIVDADAAVDCAPNDAGIVGTSLLEDELTTNKDFFAPAAGFPTTWSYDAGYVQTSLDNLPDQAIFTKYQDVGDVAVDVLATSTQVDNAITPIARQVFVTFGTKIEGGALSAVGCGIELLQGGQLFTSVVRLAGQPGAVQTTSLERTTRAAVAAGEEFRILAEVKGGTLRCRAIIKGVTTTATGTVGALTGALGFHANQTKARFRQARFCKLK
ncbi:MAG: hypothetical protein KIT84_02775 [Labilithrix sp.]|nr:hypothetical protein [Labilithrix sp.]MCW5809905.1 hypothetical protein [Labilithrix sp.]